MATEKPRIKVFCGNVWQLDNGTFCNWYYVVGGTRERGYRDGTIFRCYTDQPRPRFIQVPFVGY